MWFQMKHGVAPGYVGLLAFALDRVHTLQHLLPVCVGAFVVGSACLSLRLMRWHYTPLQCNTMMLIEVVLWAGGVFTRNLTPDEGRQDWRLLHNAGSVPQTRARPNNITTTYTTTIVCNAFWKPF